MTVRLRGLRAVTIVAATTLLFASACEKSPAPAGPAGNVEAGRRLFASTCSTCHGETGEGVQGLGKSLRGNAYVKSVDVAELTRLIVGGRAPDHPANTTGIAMPPRGGNPALTDNDVADIIAYVKSLG